jgi:CspA family cold shock protein
VTGIIKWFNQARGFGFISSGGEKDFYFHVSDLKDRPIGYVTTPEGLSVTFDVKEVEGKDPAAVNVCIEESYRSFRESIIQKGGNDNA